LIEEKKNFALLATAIVCLIGSFFALLGYVIPYVIYPNQSDHPGRTFLTNLISYDGEYYHYLDVLESITFVLIIFVLIVSILAIIASIKSKKITFINLKSILLVLAIFILLPIYDPADFVSPMIFMLVNLTGIASMVTIDSIQDPLDTWRMNYSAGFYFEALGLLFILVAFFLTIIFVFWKWNKAKDKESIIRENSYVKIKTKKTLNSIIAILSIISSLGLILGIALPYYKWIYRTGTGEDRHPSFLFPERSYFDGFTTTHKAYPDFMAVFYIVIISFILLTSCLLLLTNHGIIAKQPSKKPLMIILLIAFILPIYAPYYSTGELWFPPFMEILLRISPIFFIAKEDFLQYNDAAIDQKIVITFTGYFLYISIVLILLVIILMLASLPFKKLIKKQIVTISNKTQSESLKNEANNKKDTE